MPTIHLIIKGKVQGVAYRLNAKREADNLSVKGWVKNKDSGDVEVLVTGTILKLEEFINWCKYGPKNAIVTEVIKTEREEMHFESFSIKR
jgi:acylphosphatase